jgi:hypothetical protein
LFVQESKFKVKDRVYLLSQDGTSGEGPYLIESVPSQGMYTLCHEDDQRTAKNGDIIEEKDLVLADTKS